VASYLNFTTRLGWKPFETDALELSLTGENLFDRAHVEFNTLSAHSNNTAMVSSEQTSIPIPQDIIARATFRF
jgi:hypothetical protein